MGGIAMRFFWTQVLLLTTLTVAALSGEQPLNSGGTILDEGSYWRCFLTFRTPVVMRDGKLVAHPKGGEYPRSWAADTPAAPAGWQAATFDDSAWSRWRLPRKRSREVDYGFKNARAFSPSLAIMYLRSRFTVRNPGGAREVKLSLAYRGGAVVYVNGREIARGSLPAGKLRPETVAEEYPRDAFLKGNRAIRATHRQPERNRELVEKRIRRLNVAIPASHLRAGVNVLAIRIQRSPYLDKVLRQERLGYRTVWSTCGLVSLKLTAAAGTSPNLSRPGGVQVWCQPVARRSSPLDYADPHEKTGELRIVGCRNGRFTGKVVVASGSGLRGVTASVGDLKHAGGKGAIPAGKIEVFYTVRDDRMTSRYKTPAGGFWDTLSEKPPASANPVALRKGGNAGAIQPVVIKVTVPADAAPGEYRGSLRIDGPVKTEVPIRLSVADWKLPDPRDYVTHMGLIQSPESVAMWYKVPLWSEKHWQLMEKSFELMSQVGNRYVWVPLIARTNFGNSESMIYWIKDPSTNGSGQATTYNHDFSVFDRYMDLAQKHTRPDVVCLQLWEMSSGGLHKRPGFRGFEEGRGCRVSIRNDAGRVELSDWIKPSGPEAERFWTPVFAKLRARLKKRRLLDAAMIGLAGDRTWASKEAVALFEKLMPGGKWVQNSHPGNLRNSGWNGMKIGYWTRVYTDYPPPPAPWDAKRKCGWRRAGLRVPNVTCDIFPRYGCFVGGSQLGHCGSLALHRMHLEATLVGNLTGLGRTGVDFWPVCKGSRARSDHSSSIGARYPESTWSQLNMVNGTEALLAPGPDGALPTERFEQVREGVQLSEARIFIEKALHDATKKARLGAELTTRCQRVLDARAWRVRSAAVSQAWDWYGSRETYLLEGRLFDCAAAVAKKLGEK
jgi:hypothetical protein